MTKYRLHCGVFLALFTVAALGQSSSTGKATTNAPCSPANTGHHNSYQIRCNVTLVEGKKLTEILNKISANQLDPNQVMAKLDEILAASAKASLDQHNTGGVNVQQGTSGPNSPILNSPITIGNLPKKISDLEMTRLVEFLKQADSKVKISIWADQYSRGEPFADDFYQAFKQAGWDMKEDGVISILVSPRPGKLFQGVIISVKGEPFPKDGVDIRKDDPVYVVVQALKMLGSDPSLSRSMDLPDGVISVTFRGGFPHGN